MKKKRQGVVDAKDTKKEPQQTTDKIMNDMFKGGIDKKKTTGDFKEQLISRKREKKRAENEKKKQARLAAKALLEADKPEVKKPIEPVVVEKDGKDGEDSDKAQERDENGKVHFKKK